MAHYIHDDLNNRIEGLSKEEIYALIDEVIASGELPTDAQTAFVTALKSIVDGNPYKIGFCTTAEYNELAAQGELVEDALYIITDDSTYDDLVAAITAMQTALTTLTARVDVIETVLNNDKPNITSIDTPRIDDNFSEFYAETTASYRQQELIPHLDITVDVTPIRGVRAVMEAKIEILSGDTGWLDFKAAELYENTGKIIFKAYNSDVQTTSQIIASIASPNNTGSGLIYSRATTFKLTIKTYYNTEFTRQFTINYKSTNETP